MRHILTTRLSALAVLGLVLFSAACTDLTENPYTEITEANFDPTAEDLAALMAPVYTPLRGMWLGWHGGVDYMEEAADHFLTPPRPNGWYDGGIYIMTHEHRWGPSGQQNNMWNRNFNGITAVNRVIHQIETGVVPLEDPLYTNAMSELRGVRAYYYSLLLDNYGRVPIATDFGVTELPTQASRQEVFDFVVNELTEVIPHLSEQSGSQMHGRLNRWGAIGILARVYLNAEVYTGTPMYDQVLTLTQQIINSGHYQLDSDYRQPFARDNHSSGENIWSVPFEPPFANGNNFHMKTLKPSLRFVFGLAAQPWGGSAASPQFVNTYDEDDMRKQATFLMGPHFDDQGRGYEFVNHVPAINDADPDIPRIEFEHGYPIIKYEIYEGMLGSSEVDFPILRYAEVLMMRAEAYLRTGEAGAAATLVSQVRERAFRDTDPSKAVVTGADLLGGSVYNYGWYDVDGVVKTGRGGTPVVDGGADIEYGGFLDELGWEFAIEGHRRTHLVRFGVFTTKTWFNHVPNGDHRNVFAIPQFALDLNPNLSQNPGY